MSKADELADILRQKDPSVCLTGELTSCDRMEVMDVFDAAGLQITISVSRHTSFLLVGEGARPAKLDAAAAAGVPIFSEQEFWDAINIVFQK